MDMWVMRRMYSGDADLAVLVGSGQSGCNCEHRWTTSQQAGLVHSHPRLVHTLSTEVIHREAPMILTLAVGYVTILFGAYLTFTGPATWRLLVGGILWLPYAMLVLYIGGKV